MKHPLILMFVLMAAMVPRLWAEPAVWEKPDFKSIDPARAALGQLLFYDPILSGNQSVACATCHHPQFGTSDGVSLSIGDGGLHLGPERVADQENPPDRRIARNAPALFNLGAAEFIVMFHDGRLEIDPGNPEGIRTPLGGDMIAGFDGVLSAQAMFPVLSPDEMAGHYSENPVSRAVGMGQLSQPGGAWDLITARVLAVKPYKAMFADILGQEKKVNFTDIANVIADFIRFEWRADNSPFDQFISSGKLLSAQADAGRVLFYGKAKCAQCHSGYFQTDHKFHAIAMPQIGPGKVEKYEKHFRDTGRFRVTGRAEDAYSFRTPSLRNLAYTAPYGHDGAYLTLETIVRHHLGPITMLYAYERSQAVLAPFPKAKDWQIMDDVDEMALIEAANELTPLVLSKSEFEVLIAFLNSLNDPILATGRLGIPKTVPSGLPVERGDDR